MRGRAAHAACGLKRSTERGEKRYIASRRACGVWIET